MIDFAVAIDEHLGFVRNRGRWRVFAGYLAEWILDYAAYDPDYKQEQWAGVFRDGLLVVGPADGDRFCHAMEARELIPSIATVLFKEDPQLTRRIHFLVDFEQARFLSKFYDIAIEDYVPEGWASQFGDPLQFVPDDIQIHFGIMAGNDLA